MDCLFERNDPELYPGVAPAVTVYNTELRDNHVLVDKNYFEKGDYVRGTFSDYRVLEGPFPWYDEDSGQSGYVYRFCKKMQDSILIKSKTTI